MLYEMDENKRFLFNMPFYSLRMSKKMRLLNVLDLYLNIFNILICNNNI